MVVSLGSLASQAQAQIRTPFFGDATRMRNIHSTMYEKFLRTVEVA